MQTRFPVTCFLIFALFTSVLAQTPAPSPTPPNPLTVKPQDAPQDAQDDVVRITTNLVQIDVTVTDSGGKQITDLRPEEFEIYEDGKLQTATNFSYISLAPTEATQPDKNAPRPPVDKNAPPLPPARLRAENVRRTLALVVDDLGISFENMYFTREAIKKYIEREVQPGDLVAVIRTSGGIGALQQFTNDKHLLFAAIDKIKFNFNGRVGVFSNAPIRSGDYTTTNAQGENDGSAESLKDNNAEFNEYRNDVFAVGTLGALNYVIKGLRQLPGRKSVIMFSEGFSYLQNDNSVNQRIVTAFRQLTDLANRASVVINTIDPRGLTVPGLTAADDTNELSQEQINKVASDRSANEFNSRAPLIELARMTGGRAIYNNNDIGGGIRRILSEQSGYYLLGYRPDEKTFDAATGRRLFHRISVKVKRPGAQVRTRSGFFGVPDSEARPVLRTRRDQIVNALTSPFAESGVNVRLSSFFGNDAKAGSFVRSLLYIDGRGLTFMQDADGFYKAVFDVVALTFGDNGAVIDEINTTQTIRVRGKTYEKVLSDGFIMNAYLPVKKPGVYQLRVAVRDTTSEHVGSATQLIEIPNLKKNRLTLSGLVVNNVTPSVRTTATSSPAVANADDDELTNPALQISPAVRQFRHGDFLDYGLLIFNAKPDKATARPQLTVQLRLLRDGQEVFAAKPNPVRLDGQTDLQRIAYTGRLKLGTDLKPGDYVLQVVVTDNSIKGKFAVATQWADFEILPATAK